MSECTGWLGRIFGHKFIKKTGGYIYTSVYCYRCGAVRGGTELKTGLKPGPYDD